MRIIIDFFLAKLARRYLLREKIEMKNLLEKRDESMQQNAKLLRVISCTPGAGFPLSRIKSVNCRN